MPSSVISLTWLVCCVVDKSGAGVGPGPLPRHGEVGGQKFTLQEVKPLGYPNPMGVTLSGAARLTQAASTEPERHLLCHRCHAGRRAAALLGVGPKQADSKPKRTRAHTVGSPWHLYLLLCGWLGRLGWVWKVREARKGIARTKRKGHSKAPPT